MMEKSEHSNQKVADACEALASFGFPEEKVKVTLKRLARLYNNDWKFIEEENYRAVIDILIDRYTGEEKVRLKKKQIFDGDRCSDDGGEFRCVKRGLTSQNGQASSSSGKRARISPSTLCAGNARHEDYFEATTRETGSIFLKDAKDPPAAGRYSKGNSSECETDDSKLKDLKALDMENRVAANSHPLQFDVASSANKEVKISLTCNSAGHSISQRQTFGAALREVENECRRMYTIEDSDFSLTKLMNKVCEYFLKMDSGPSNKIAPIILGTSPKSCQNDVGDTSLQPNNQNVGVKDHIIPQDVNVASKENIKLLEFSGSLKSRNMEAVLQKRYPIYPNDITRGQESVEISLVNECSNIELPDFMYIKNNMAHDDAQIVFSLARISDRNCCSQCRGDCLSSALPCACAAETQGEFAYTQEGLLKEEFVDECIAMTREPQRKHFYYCEICPLQNSMLQKGKKIKRCEGHLTRKFIKECWFKCGCSKHCGNRIVQRGIQVALQVFATPEGKGWGLRPVNALKKGTFICEYVGEIVTNQELYDRNKERTAVNEKHTYPVLLDADWGSERILKDEEALCLDATEFGNVGRFINHRCYDANLFEVPVEVETPDHHYYHLAFFTVRDIEAMEELTWDYGIEFGDKHHPIKAFKCKCGSKYCRSNRKKLS